MRTAAALCAVLVVSAFADCQTGSHPSSLACTTSTQQATVYLYGPSPLAAADVKTATVNGVDVLHTVSALSDGVLSVTHAPAFTLKLAVDLGSFSFNVALEAHPTYAAARFLDDATTAAASQALCVGDVDGSGTPDVFVAVSGRPNALYLTSAAGELGEDVATERGLSGSGSEPTSACVWADFDDDGDLDLATASNSAGNHIFLQSPSGVFGDATASSGFGGAAPTVSLATASLFGSSYMDIVVCNALPTPSEPFINSGTAQFVAGSASGIAFLGPCRQALIADFDDDGDLDVFVAMNGATHAYLLNTGATYDDGAASSGLGLVASAAAGAATADLNTDGLLDIVVAQVGLPPQLFLNRGDGTFTDVGPAWGVPPGSPLSSTQSSGVVAFDAFNTGVLSVVLPGVEEAPAFLMGVTGGLFASQAGVVAVGAGFGFRDDATTTGAVTLDIDGDGDLDVMVAGEGGAAYYNSATSPPPAVTVRPLTSAGAPSAFGTTVRIQCVSGCAAKWASVRVVDGGSSYRCQSAYDVHFGVPDPAAGYNVSVAWKGAVASVSDWQTHAGLGGIVPADTPAALRTRVVRFDSFEFSFLGAVPWDFPGVTERLGETPGVPTASDLGLLAFSTVPPTEGLTALEHTVNGVSAGWAPEPGTGLYVLAYTTPAADVNWPWTGLQYRFVLTDGSAVHVAEGVTVPGSTWDMPAPSARGLSALASVNAYGLCAGDMDADGDIDVLVAFDGRDKLFVNDGSGVFTEEAVVRGMAVYSDLSFACQWVDVDGDGDLDAHVVVQIFSNELYINDGSGSFTEEGTSRGLHNIASTISAMWADVDGDGDVDCLALNYAAANVLHLNDGAGVFAEFTSTAGFTDALMSRYGAAADVDGDGDVDFVVLNDNAAGQVFVNDGGGVFAEDGAARGFSPVTDRASVRAADVNSDGHVDLVVMLFDAPVVYLNSGWGVFTTTDVGFLDATGTQRGFVMVDFEHDGDVDLFSATMSGAAYMWSNSWPSPTYRYTSIEFGVTDEATAWAASAADFDGDGDLDVLLSESGVLHVNYNARPAVANWVKIRPLTAAGAPSAFGATVRMACVAGCAREWAAVRVVDGGGARGQSGYDAHFGLPTPTLSAFNATVAWPGATPSSYATHPALGSMTSFARVVVVRHTPFALSRILEAPWWGDDPPLLGSGTSVAVIVSPEAATDDVTIFAATINGQDVLWTFSRFGTVLTVTYVVPADAVEYPWAGLEVDVVFVDGGGVEQVVNEKVVRGATFVESPEWGLAGLATTSGSCMGDVDGDGDVDVFVAGNSGLWMNTGGRLVEVGPAWGLPSTSWQGCAWGDADGDGDLDLLVSALLSHPPDVFINGGSALVAAGDQLGVPQVLHRGRSVAWADMNGDGASDALLCVSGGSPLLLLNSDTGFTDVASSWGFTACHDLAVLDADDDGTLDVATVSSTAADSGLFLNAGPGFSDAAVSSGFVSFGGESVAAGDLTGDGVVDLYVVVSAATDFLFAGDGGGGYTMHAVAASTTVASGLCLVDLDHDGDVDVFVPSFDSLALDATLVNTGGGAFYSPDTPWFNLDVDASHMTALPGDLDGDGDLELVSGYTGAAFVNRHSRVGLASWLLVRPLTAAGAQSAHGATVAVHCVAACRREWHGASVIGATAGVLSQAAYDAHFGIPYPDAAHNVTVAWASASTPAATWATHPGLGSLTPSALLPSARLIVVRAVAFHAALGVVPAWDYPAVASRAGQPVTRPAAGSTVAIPLVTQPPATGLLLTAGVPATVNGQGVRATFQEVGGGEYVLEYTTTVGAEEWPWTGLHVSASLSDTAGLSAVVSAFVVPGSTFEAAPQGVSAVGGGVCLADANGDGAVDVLNVDAGGGGVQLWVWTPSGFEDATAAVFGTIAGALSGCSWVDLDGTGIPSLYLTAPGANLMLCLTGTFGSGGMYVDVAAGSGLAVAATTTSSASWADLNGDGGVDVFVCSASAVSPNTVLMNLGGVFFDEGPLRGVQVGPQASQQVVLFDADGDGAVDAFVANWDADDELLMNDGAGQFSEEGLSRGVALGGSSWGLAVGDIVGGDGTLDVYVASFTAADYVLSNDGGGVFSRVALAGAGDGFTRGVAVCDLELDGDVDVVVGVESGADVVWLQGSGGLVLAAPSLAMGAESDTFAVAAGDLDGDGDPEVAAAPTTVAYTNHNTRPSGRRWIKVVPTAGGGSRTAFGATVRLTCASGCATPWQGVRVVDGGSGFRSQGAYGAEFGLPEAGGSYDVSVVFPGGATHDPTTDAGLGGVAPGTVLTVSNRPYFTGIVVDAAGPLVPLGAPLVVTVTAGLLRPDLTPSPDCCYVNDVNVAANFTSVGDGTYTVTYVPDVGHGSWLGGGLRLRLPLAAPSGVSSDNVTVVVEGSPGGDTVPPDIMLACGPGPVSGFVWETLCLEAPSEGLFPVTFLYAVNGGPEQAVPAANFSSPTAATLLVGPFANDDAVVVEVSAVDAAGNTATLPPLEWTVDTSSPITSLLTTPAPNNGASSRSDATFTLACSEADCSFSYVVNGAAAVQLGGNGTAAGEDVVDSVDTVVVRRPPRTLASPNVSVTFAVNASSPGLLVNASVSVTVGTATTSLPLEPGTDAAPPLNMTLPDGTHTFTARAAAGSGATDTTPAVVVVTVDTVPPTVAVHEVPSWDEPGGEFAVVGSSEPAVFWWRAGAAAAVGAAAWSQSPTGVLEVGGIVGGVEHALEVYGVDGAGNMGERVAVSWVPQSCPAAVPDVAVGDDVLVGDGARYVRFAAVGGGDWPAFQYALDGGEWVTTAMPRVILPSVAVDTTHTLALRAAVASACDEELAGVRPAPVVVAWTHAGLGAPRVAFLDLPPPSTPDVFAEFLVEASPAVVALEYRLDTEPGWTPCAAMLRVGPLSPGPHTLSVRGRRTLDAPPGDAVTASWSISSSSDSSVILSGLPDGWHSLTVTAVDAAGGTEIAPQTFRWRVDTTPPDTSAVLTSPRFSTSRTAAVAVGCVDAADCVICWESGSVGVGCSPNSTLHLEAPSDGTHSVDVFAVDAVGLPDPHAVPVAWTADATPPTTSWADVNGALKPAPPALSGDVGFVLSASSLALNLTANEPVSGFQVTLYGNAWPPGSPPGTVVPGGLITLDGLQALPTPVTITAVDLAGNVEAAPAALAALVDLTPPQTSITSLPPSPTKDATLAVGVSATDGLGGSGVASVVVVATPFDGSPPHAATLDAPSGVVTLGVLPSGTYNLTCVAVDFAGSEDPAPAWALMTVDLVPPVAQVALLGPPVSPLSRVVVEVTSNEEAAVAARVPGGAWVPGNGSVVTLAGLPDGNYSVEAQATDAAGNVNPAPFPAVGVVVDTEAPVLEWAPGFPEFTASFTASTCVAATDATAVAFNATSPQAGVVWSPAHPNGVCVNVTAGGDGEVVVEIVGVDEAGTESAVLNATLVVDSVPPLAVVATPLEAASSSCVTVAGVTVCDTLDGAMLEVSCTDGSPGVRVAPCHPQHAVVALELAVDAACVNTPSARRLQDGGEFSQSPVGAPFPLPVATDGLYRVTVRAVDAAGNVQPDNSTADWHVDTVAPVNPPTFVQTPDKLSASTRALFLLRLEGDDSPGQTTLWYSLDSSPPAAVPDLPSSLEAVVQLTVPEASTEDLGVGGHVIRVWAVDQAGHGGPSALYDWAVVDQAPGVVLASVPAPVSGTDDPVFVAQAVWAPGVGNGRSGVETSAAMEVSTGVGFSTLCADTALTGGNCTWSPRLDNTGTHSVTVRAVFGGVSGEPVTYTWEYHLCGDDEYATLGPATSIACSPCPAGGNCDGGLTTLAEVVALPDFWAESGSSGLEFFECRRADACLPAPPATTNATTVDRSVCAEGFTGVLCGVCADGYFEQFGTCARCSGSKAVSSLVVVFVIVGFMVFGALMWRFRTILPRQTVKVVFTMSQIVALGSSAYDIPWPPAFKTFLGGMQLFLMDVLSLTRAQCTQPMTYFESTLVTFIVFKSIMVPTVLGSWLWHHERVRRWRFARRQAAKSKKGVPAMIAAATAGLGAIAASLVGTASMAVGSAVRDDEKASAPQGSARTARVAGPSGRRRAMVVPKRNHRRRQSVFVSLTSAQLWAPIFRTLFFFLFITYGGITLRVFRMFKCVPVAGDWWLVADMRLQCFTGQWYGYAMYAFIMGVVFVAGLPAAVIAIMFQHRHRLGDPDVVTKWGFLFDKYGSHAWFWEAEELLRRLIMTGIPLLLSDGTAFQVALAVMVCGWAHVIHGVFKPWGAGNVWYYLQHASLSLTTFVFLLGLLFKVDGVDHGGLAYNFLAWGMVVGTAVFLIWGLTLAALQCGRGVVAERQDKKRAKAAKAVNDAFDSQRKLMPGEGGEEAPGGREEAVLKALAEPGGRTKFSVAAIRRGTQGLRSPPEQGADAGLPLTLGTELAWATNPLARGRSGANV